MITQNTIQQILSRVEIIDVVGTFIKLKRRGANYLGLCPFHNEKSPSFTVSPSKEIYKCFGCGKTGNSISFLMEAEKYSYVEALRWLAQKYNVHIEETEQTPEQKMLQQVSDSLYIVNQFAQKFFSEQLTQTSEGEDIALSYLKERGFSREIIEKFQIGYNPSARDTFAKAALDAQYSKDILLKTGLINERDGNINDNYRGRIIFPIHNQSGKVLGFGARIIKSNDKAPKYINTPENDIYVKSKILYGSYFARTAIDKADECLLVEGYTDVVSLAQAGVENVVASGGTSLTPDQLRLVKKYTNNLTIIYDGDNAGIKAAMRGLDLALEAGLNVQLVLIPDGEDPDSYVNKIGATNFKEFVANNKKDVILFQLDQSLKEAGNDINKRKLVINHIAETISKVNKVEDFSKQQYYVKQSADLLKIEESGMLELVNKFIREKISKENTRTQQGPSLPPLEHSGYTEDPGAPAEDDIGLLLNKDNLQERGFVRTLLEFGHYTWDESQNVAQYLIQEFEDNDFAELFDNVELVTIVKLYKQALHKGETVNTKTFLYHSDEQISGLIAGILEFNYDLSPKWNEFAEGKLSTKEDLYREDVISTLTHLKLRKIKRMIMDNEKDLRTATDDTDIMAILRTHQSLKQIEMALTKSIGSVILK